MLSLRYGNWLDIECAAFMTGLYCVGAAAAAPTPARFNQLICGVCFGRGEGDTLGG